MSKCVPIQISSLTFEPSDGSDPNLCPVIFIHGLTGSKEMWVDIPQIIADKTKRKAYAIDARNHGESSFTDDIRFADNVQDVFHFMDTMNIPKAVLVGHSMGGIAATHAALTKPERVEMVFSEDIFINKLPKEIFMPLIIMIKGWYECVKLIPKGCTESEAIKTAVEMVCSQIPDDHPMASMKESMRKTNFRLKRNKDGTYNVNYNYKALMQKLENNPEDVMSDSPPGQFDGSTIFICGGVSPFTANKDEVEESIRKKFPNAEFIKIPDASHNLHVEFPDEFINIIIKHLKTK